MRRVVITGMGMLTPLGCGVETTWRRILAGESGVRKNEKVDVSDLPCKIAASLPRGDGKDGTYNPRLVKVILADGRELTCYGGQ